jgi:hypothetical protein
MATLGIAIVATSLLPHWLGRVAIVIAAPNGIGLFLTTDVWNVVSGLPSLWTLVLAVLLLVRADRYSDSVTPPLGG